MSASYEIALAYLGLKPDEFWRLAPREFSDMAVAFKVRSNREARQRAFELSLLLSPWTKEGDEGVAPENLWRAMPFSFPEEEVALSTPAAPRMSTKREKRLRHPRQNKPGRRK